MPKNPNFPQVFRRPSNPSPMELGIYMYEKKAAKFHKERDKEAPLNETKSQKSKRLDQARRDKLHLLGERRKLAAHAKIQKELREYRTASLEKDEEDLVAENHHPTKILARNLLAVGEPKPTIQHEAHHIIPGKGRYLQEELIISRLNLHSFGVGINDPINGLWLTNFKKNKENDWATSDAPSHRSLHRYNYEKWISSNFSNDNLPEKTFLGRLTIIKRKIKNGKMPDKVMMPKDKNWNGQ
ncbi:putative large secreted protein [Vibrio nigripulchritudo SFn118]|nr:putative large secreted protein [Vibrio nigripulchritudo SFn118]